MRVKDLKIKDLLHRSPEYCRGASLLLVEYCLFDDGLELFELSLSELPPVTQGHTHDRQDISCTFKNLERYHDILASDLLDGEKEALKTPVALNKINLTKQYCQLLDKLPKHNVEDVVMDDDEEAYKKGIEKRLGSKMDVERYLLPDAPDHEELIPDRSKDENPDGELLRFTSSQTDMGEEYMTLTIVLMMAVVWTNMI